MRPNGLLNSLRSGAHDTASASRVLGVLYLAGALFVAFSVLLPHPDGAGVAALLGIAGTAGALGGASLAWATRARATTVHAGLAAGTALISLCIHFAGVASGIYASMFVWVVLLAASFFARRAVAAHVGWILVSWGLALTTVTDPTGFSMVTRWAFGSFVLLVAAVVMAEIVGGRRTAEEQLRRVQGELAHLAHHDPLTGVANRRLFARSLAGEIARATRHGTPLAVVALDLDNFKEFNDEHGHAAGDQLLLSATIAWSQVLRGEDLLARLGGDEFVALLPDCPPAGADRAAQRLRGVLPPGHGCSTGIAYWDGRESGEEFLTRADVALYEAKKQARARPTVVP